MRRCVDGGGLRLSGRSENAQWPRASSDQAQPLSARSRIALIATYPALSAIVIAVDANIAYPIVAHGRELKT
jgi:hypothetical protein